MPIITLNGQYGAGGIDIGTAVARQLDLDYVDRDIIAEAAKRLGATVEALAEKEERSLSLRERLTRLMQNVLERSAVAGGGEDPVFGSQLGVLLGRDYPQVMREPISRADELDDQRFIQVTREVIQEVASLGRAVIVGRGSNIILRDHPGALHVGLVAPLEERIARIAQREGVSREDAARRVNSYDRARLAFFRKLFKVHPDDPGNFHLILNTHFMDESRAVAVVIQAARF